MNTKALTTFAIALTAVTSAASAQIRITEWMYSGDPEYVELTNVGDTAIDVTGWSYDDDSRLVGVYSLSEFGSIAAGESIIINNGPAAHFRGTWGLDNSVRVIDSLSFGGWGRNDEINIFDASGTLVDQLIYGDQDFPGSIRTAGVSGNFYFDDLGNPSPYDAVASTVGDDFGSWSAGASGFVGNPGQYTVIPAPASAGALCLAGFAAARRRRA